MAGRGCEENQPDRTEETVDSTLARFIDEFVVELIMRSLAKTDSEAEVK